MSSLVPPETAALIREAENRIRVNVESRSIGLAQTCGTTVARAHMEAEQFFELNYILLPTAARTSTSRNQSDLSPANNIKQLHHQ